MVSFQEVTKHMTVPPTTRIMFDRNVFSSIITGAQTDCTSPVMRLTS